MESQIFLRNSNAIFLETCENYREGGSLWQVRPPGEGGGPDVTPKECGIRQMAEAF
jgi:hypothetical protein